ncbi:MAG: hypothetical protein ACR2QM_05335 [Longimicrobiales bacterium]
MSSTALATRPDSGLTGALRRLDGRGTLGDVVSATGLSMAEAETALKQLLETHRGHLEVSDSGELVYQFDPAVMVRGKEGFLTRLKRRSWSLFKAGFKVWTATMLVVYFVVFVGLAIAALTANRDNRGGFGRGRGGISDLLFWHWMFGGRRWRRGGLYYGHRHAKRLPKEAQPPFYKKVFAFLFGPDEPKPTQLQKDRSLVKLIRARSGVLTSTELVEHTGLPLPEADEEMGRLTGAYGGEPIVSDKGEIVYAFPELMTSAHSKVAVREPNPAWLRLEYPKELTGNDKKSDTLIAAMNGFNLLAGLSAPALIFPRLGIGGPLAVLGLVAVPTVFSSLFFGIPLFRRWGLKRENKKRMKRNVRKLLIGLVYKRSVGAVRWISADDATKHVTARLKGFDTSPKHITKELEKLASEFNADVDVDEAGEVRYRFPDVRESFVEGELVRRQLQLENKELGEIVYDTADTSVEGSEKDLAAFDRELASAQIDLSKYLPSPDKVGFEEDFALVDDDEPPSARRSA